jgi:hypothetical protein
VIQPVGVTVAETFDAAVQVLGLSLLAAAVSLGAAFGYRWYARDRIAEGIAVLLGVAAVAVVLNTQSALQSAIVGQTDLLDPASAAFTIGAFAAAAVAADVGRRVGDRAAQRTAPMAALRDLGEMGQIVRSGGRGVTVALPADPGDFTDIDGYDPVPDTQKEALAGTTLSFPRGLTVAELRERLVRRLREDHGVGHVDVELTPEGELTYLGVGMRPAGIGATLAPGTTAVAIRADPSSGASLGDAVQVWTGGEDPERVTTGELRGVAGDVVTLAVDEPDADELDDETRYRIVSLPTESETERDFVGLLRAADETIAAVTVEADSPLVGVPVGALDATVVAVRSGAGVEAIPSRSRVVRAGDVVYVVARPDALRRFEAAAAAGSGDPPSAPVAEG